MDLDHVALAFHDVTDALRTFVGDLGAVVLDGGQAVGFRIVQVRAGRPPHLEDPGEGMTVELIEPWAQDRFDFLVRFLERNGEGPHHLTFKSTDLQAQIQRMDAAGFTPVRTQLTNPWWREAFFHPKDTFGTVIQVAEATFDPSLAPEHEEPSGDFGSVEWWPEPPPRAEPRMTLRRVALRVPDLDDAVEFFGGVLGGDVERSGATADVSWPGGGCLRLEHRPDQAPGIDRLDGERDGDQGEVRLGSARIVIDTPGRAD